MTEEEIILNRVADGVSLITFNRPDRLNAWSPAMSERYFDLLDGAADDPDVRVVVVTGNGRGFCAGMDMKVLQTVGTTTPRSDPRARKALYTRHIPKPVVAAVNGACVGVGLVLACAADIRFAVPTAKMSAMFTRRGLPAEDGLSWLLPRLVGVPRAMELLLSGRIFTGEEAYAYGLVHELLPPERLLERALAYASDLATNCAPTSMAAVKRQVYDDLDRDVEAALRIARDLRDEAVAAPDFAEGVASFLDKRPPRFAPLPPRTPTGGAAHPAEAGR